MPQLINYGNEMLRISSKGIEYSTTNGRSWNKRYSGSVYGDFIDLLPYGNELLAVTTRGIYYSTTGGRSWNSRFTGSVYGTFNSLVDGGRELLANTSKGLYFSTTCGRSWNRRRQYVYNKLLTIRIIKSYNKSDYCNMEILIQPTIDNLREDLGYNDYEDVDEDALLFQQGYNGDLIIVDDGESFEIPEGYIGNIIEDATTYYIEIEIMPGLIDKEEFIGELEAGLYKLNDGIISREHNKEE